MAKAVDRGFHQEIGRLFQEGTIAGLTDAELLDRYLTRRDELAFETLVRLHGPMVLGLCRRMLRDRQEIEDAFQATFMILIRKAPTLRDRTLLANWLYGVAYRVAVQARKNSIRRNAGKTPSDRLDEVPSDQPEASDLADWVPILDQELTRLPEKYRTPLILCYLNGRTHEQSAGQLGIPVGTIRSRLARGRDLLKRRLLRRGVTPGAMLLGRSPTTVPTLLVQNTLTLTRSLSKLKALTATIGGGTVTTSAISLAQGVLSTMFLGKLKIAAIGLVTLALVGGGIAQGVRAFASGQGDQPTVVQEKVGVPSQELGKGTSPTVEQRLEARIKELEGKIDQLIAITPRGSRQTEEESSNRMPPVLKSSGFKRELGMSLPEFEMELQILKRRLTADREFIKFQKAAHRVTPEGRLSDFVAATQRFDETRDSIQRLIARLLRFKQELEGEKEELVFQHQRKEAEVRVEHAAVEIEKAKVARNDRLNERFKGAVSDEDRAKDESTYRLAAAREDVVAADLEFLTMRLKNIDIPRKSVDELITQAKAIDLSDSP